MRRTIVSILAGGILVFAALCTASEHVVVHELSESKTIYVDDDAALYGDGKSWGTAYTFLQDALAEAVAGDEVRVGQGVYRPDRTIMNTAYSSGDRGASFELMNGVTVRGAYAGTGAADPNVRDVGAADPNVRDVELYETVLSGDLLGNDVDPGPRLGGEALWVFMKDDSRADNSYSVVDGSDTNHTAVLEGVTITGGNATRPKPARNSGGAVGGYGGRPLLRDCTLFRNWAFSGGAIENYDTEFSAEEGGVALIGCRLVENAAVYGGAIYNNEGSPKVVDSSFVRNTAQRGGAIDGDSHERLIRCTFIENSARDRGESPSRSAGYGGAICHLGTLRVADCVFAGNSASHGGAVYIAGWTSASVERVLFAGNVAEHSGGAVFVEQVSYSQVFLNCTFAENVAGQGAAVACQPDKKYIDRIDFRIGNCIFRDGGDEIFSEYPETVKMSFSNVEGGFEGRGNIDVDPLFALPGRWDDSGSPDDPNDDKWVEGDYHLRSKAGRWDAGRRQWVQDESTSECIDAGDPQSAIMHEPFASGGIVNMGAYGGTAEASKSYFGEPPCETIVAGDINGDCKVNYLDLGLMALHWCEDNNP